MTIGYYIHHQGLGHLTRAQSIARACGQPVVALSSLPAPPTAAPFAGWIALERDDANPSPRDVTAGGALHWAPLELPGYSARMHRIADWVAAARPSVVVIDVSVEVAALVRLLGVPVVVMAGPGVRADAAHQMAYAMASRIVAPWPQDIYDPGHLAPFASTTAYVGAISRFDGCAPVPAGGGRTVLSLFGNGGSRIGRAERDAARAATPDWTWRHLGGDGEWSGDVWAALQGADVVVAHAGQNALAEIAAARRPAILIPQDRPFGEQHATARALASAGIALAAESWPTATDWPGLLDDAARMDGRRWSRWSDGAGAARAAAAIEEAASA